MSPVKRSDSEASNLHKQKEQGQSASSSAWDKLQK